MKQRKQLTMADVHRIFFEPAPYEVTQVEPKFDWGVIVLVIGVVLTIIGIFLSKG